MPIDEILSLSRRDEWRSWLTKNHMTRDCVWVNILKKNAGKKGLRLDEAVDEAIRFGWIDGKMRSVSKESFILRFTKRRPNSVWSKINRERAERMMHSGRMMPAGLASVEEAKRNGKWDKAYTSRISPIIPKDLGDALKAHPPAMENFQHLSNSAKLQLITWIDEAKKMATRKKRIKECIEKMVNSATRDEAR